ncbi:hypothetical protein MSAS_22080 [Mycobacterium saskatchewanense]|nr:hypothetical protein MSAS_22080 [Mycobacterium saskatchewanense]
MCLCGVGAPGYGAVTAVHADGSTVLLVAETARIGDTTAVFDAACSDAPHEQPGPLAAGWRDRIALAPIRCGRATRTTGRPCRQIVTHAGAACARHRQPTTTTTDVHDEGNAHR